MIEGGPSLGQPLSLGSRWRLSGSRAQKAKGDAECGAALSRSRGTARLDDWVAYIVGTTSNNLILADHVSERKVKHLLFRMETMSKEEVQKIAKG